MSPGGNQEAGNGPSVTFSSDVVMDYGRNPEANTVKYIVNQNTKLHEDIEKLRTESVHIKRQLADAEYNSTSSEKSRVCLRCVAHNEIEKSRILRDIVAKHEESRKAVTSCVSFLCATSLSILLVSAGRAYGGEDIYLRDEAWVSLVGCCLAVVAACFIPVNKAKLQSELLRVEKGTAHIHELIDEL